MWWNAQHNTKSTLGKLKSLDRNQLTIGAAVVIVSKGLASSLLVIIPDITQHD